jgi:hypothetical protein
MMTLEVTNPIIISEKPVKANAEEENGRKDRIERNGEKLPVRG